MDEWMELLAALAAGYQVPAFTPETLCDLCENACGRCCWSRKDEQRPVPGWDAVRRDVPMRYEDRTVWMESYVVLWCPQFVLEDRSRIYWDKFDAQALREKALRGWEEE